MAQNDAKRRKKAKCDRTTDRPTNRRTEQVIESCARD